MIDDFYSSMADYYHLTFGDWELSIKQQSAIVARLTGSAQSVGRILDVACGIGTQALGLSMLGYEVDGSDISPQVVQRALRESAARGLHVRWRVDDMRFLSGATPSSYGVVICMDNALPHLDDDEEISQAFRAMRSCLRPGGLILVSVRDYARLMPARPTITEPKFYGSRENRRIVFQIWDWVDERRYLTHLYLTSLENGKWRVRHSLGSFRSVTPDEVVGLMIGAGFAAAEVLSEEDTGFHQPIVRGLAP